MGKDFYFSEGRITRTDSLFPILFVVHYLATMKGAHLRLKVTLRTAEHGHGDHWGHGDPEIEPYLGSILFFL